MIVNEIEMCLLYHIVLGKKAPVLAEERQKFELLMPKKAISLFRKFLTKL